MAESAASTAYGPMVLVALEQTLPQDRRITDDTLAYQMLPPYMKLMVRISGFSPVRHLFFSLMDKNMPGLRGGFPCRKRYIDDKVIEALDAGIEAVVILGAGLDTLAYRLSGLARVRVYEVDLPENIVYKKKQLEAIFGAIPAHVTLIPIDFETHNLEDTLKQHGFTFDRKTMFVWEAVTQYLTEDAVRTVFGILAHTKPGSRLVFTYVLQDFLDGDNRYGLDSLYQRFRVKSQIWKFGLHPQAVADFIGGYGWTMLEQVGGEGFASRYLKPVGRTEPITEIERAVSAEKVSS